MTWPRALERDLVSLVVQDVQPGDVLGPVPLAGLGLDQDLPGLAVEVEVVDVIGTEVGLEDAEDVGDGDAEAPGLGPVDVEAELRDPGREVREHAGQLGPPRAASRNRSVTEAVASTPLPSRSSIMKSKPPV